MPTATLDPRYVIQNADEVFTPAIAVYPELIRANLSAAIRMAGDPARMRPHCKTHKTIELTRLELEAGIVKHKCATFAEAEVLAAAGVRDIVLAYPLVGPNVRRFLDLVQRYPACSFKPLVDHPAPLRQLGAVMSAAGKSAEVLLDLDVGMSRTGVPANSDGLQLYGLFQSTPGIAPGGLHVYDGQNHQHDAGERKQGVDAVWQTVRDFTGRLEAAGLSVPRLVCGNSASYPFWAKLAEREPRLECSPGTFFLNDWNYYRWFEDIPLQPAAVLLTRVVSKPRPGRVTLDLGYKAVASDSPMDRRVQFLDLPNAVIALQNEEHLVVDTPAANELEPGDLLYAWPAHICPSCALHQELLVVENNRLVGAWKVAARDRRINC